MTLTIFPAVRFCQIGRGALNERLLAWGHRMGPVRRPTGGWSHGLFHDDELVAVVATDSLIRPRVAGLTRQEAIELSRALPASWLLLGDQLSGCPCPFGQSLPLRWLDQAGHVAQRYGFPFGPQGPQQDHLGLAQSSARNCWRFRNTRRCGLSDVLDARPSCRAAPSGDGTSVVTQLRLERGQAAE